MNKNKIVWAISALILAAILIFADHLPVIVLLDAGPLWIYFVITGILLSGYLAISNMLNDKEIDKKFIEKEGQVYMERIAQKRQSK